MLYIAAVPCGETKEDEHKAAWALLESMLAVLCPDADLSGMCKRENGKPYLKGRDVSFSLSHTKGAALCALSCEGDNKEIPLPKESLLFSIDVPHGEIGADIEWAEREREFSKIADTFFSEEEKEYLQNAPNKADAFYRIYTGKESLLKASGVGISGLRRAESVLNADNIHTYNISLSGKQYILSVALLK